jgi:hypothetical protein
VSPLRLYFHAARAARPRQVFARAARPLRRRWFPRASAACCRQIESASELWRSPAFERSQLDPRGAETRLYSFHQEYGEDVLEAARAGDPSLALERIESWIAAHPPQHSDAWHPYVASTRAGNWIAAMTLEPHLATERVADSLARQVAHVAANVENDILGNHVIRKARALVLGGLALDSGRLVERGLRLLRRELPDQVLPDGGHYERSPVYHSIVLRDLLEIEAATGQPFLRPVVDRMEKFASALARPDGAPALFNDGTVDLAPRVPLPPANEGVIVFPDTGYVVVRAGRLWLAFDCGPPAPTYLPAHAHADALSIQVWVGQVPAVVDPGVSTYAAGTIRTRERGTAAHSTVTVDGADQFAVWDAFRSGPLPQVRLISAELQSAEAIVSYSGVCHARSLAWTEESLLVTDVVTAAGNRTLESRLVLAPEAPVVITGDESVELVEGLYSEKFFQPQRAVVALQRLHCNGGGRLRWTLRLP